MPASISQRVALRWLDRTAPRVVVAHVDHENNPWGWAFPGIHRMHLMPLTPSLPAALFWLERKGVRAFELGGGSVPEGYSLDALRCSVGRARGAIEAAWLRWCVDRDWVDYSPHEATVFMYSGTPCQFARRLPHEAFKPELLRADPMNNTAQLEAALNEVIWLDREG